jgi:hypothetical protein
MLLRVRVNDDLVLDAGMIADAGAKLVVHPPSVTLFHQVLAYLRERPDPAPPKGSQDEREGLATVAVTLRWGSYLAVLADTRKPIWSEAKSPGVSRISDTEMACINIEASAALAGWVDIARLDPPMYEKLVARALAYLPMPKTRVLPAGTEFAMLAMPDVAEKMTAAAGPDRLTRLRSNVEAHASRIFANALVNVAWRNGPVENVHAGRVVGYPLDHRRVTAAEERDFVSFAADRMTTGMGVCRGLASERGRAWPEQVLPYGISMAVAPTGWSLTEATREVRLSRS